MSHGFHGRFGVCLFPYCTALIVFVLTFRPQPVPAFEEEKDPVSFSLLPGESRAISHGLSASRDTGLLAYQVLPQVVLSREVTLLFWASVFPVSI